MSRMNPIEQINKASWTLMEGIKDAVSTNITTAVNGGVLKLDAEQTQRLLSLLGLSIEEGYHRGHRVFERIVAAAFESLKPTNRKR